MHSNLPTHLQPRARELEADIRRAFAGVTREGGVSWSEAEVVDDYGTNQDRAEARARDRDRSWEQLVEDVDWWDGHSYLSNFSFLDPIGFRYYLPAAMIKTISTRSIQNLPYALTLRAAGKSIQIGGATYSLDEVNDHFREQWSLLSADQARCVAQFLRLMYEVDEALGHDFEKRNWSEAHASHWHQFDPDPTPLAGSDLK